MEHALTIRLPPAVYQAAKKLATRQGISLNRLVQDALSEKAVESLGNRLSRAYAILAEDADAGDIARSFAAQTETLLEG
jgi:hypothetical protein